MTERDVFEAALELPPQARAAYLDGVSGSDAALRQRVEALLRQHDQAAGFLERPAVPGLVTAHAAPGRRRTGGASLGPPPVWRASSRRPRNRCFGAASSPASTR